MKILKAVFKVLLGLSLGLAIAEVGFRVRDDGAFPHLNFYVADDKQGVRLEPNAEMKLRVGDNPITTVRTNSRGYRGADWPAPAPGELLVVGDSQVFGLGVEDGETFSVKLGEALKVPVLNLGVPTWGPGEYSTAVEEVLAERKPAAVIYVLNLSNDLFEADRANATRHKVWDGWAVRAETAPKEVMNFPFRKALMSRSHLVFGARKLMHVASTADDGFASEGTWRDVVSASDSMKAQAADEPTRKFLEARARLDAQLKTISSRLEESLENKVYDPDVAEELNRIARPGGDAQDIFEEGDAEGGRSVNTTVMHLITAAMGESKNEAFLEKLAEEKDDKDLKALLVERKKLREEVRALKLEAAVAHEVPLDHVLLRTRKACEAAGARLIVVGLPLDVMVSADEWKKYGARPIDLAPTAALREGLMRRIEAVGAEAVDPLDALAKAEPGAFLSRDLHMSPKGHAALALALAEIVKAGPKKTLLALPAGRTWPPTEDEWKATGECTVKGSSAAGCVTKLLREWLWVDCGDEAHPVTSLTPTAGGHGDVWAVRDEGHGKLLIPILEGDAARVQFDWKKTSRELQLDFPKGGKLTMAFAAPKPVTPAPVWWSPGNPNDPLSDSTCPEGYRLGGALRRCAPACDERTPCKSGHCEPWPTGDFCASP
ncbi:MAG: hypothetical protein Q8L48_12550 [Archangium sp.]|nr:hypothetical protein [Archangium sp.]